MRQYLELLKTIKEKATHKPAAREGMPGTQSLFGYQFRHDLAEGFPLLTSKKMFWKGVVTELLWFPRGDTNIKYLVDNGCNIWNEDAYNYYVKRCKEQKFTSWWSFEDFITCIKSGKYAESSFTIPNYKPGDCGYQYGKLWRDWEYTAWEPEDRQIPDSVHNKVDQVKELIDGLKSNPMSRRHLLTSWNPATLDQMALNACHVLVQFNCRPVTREQSYNYAVDNDLYDGNEIKGVIPKYYLDCQLYQRSADVFLGVPFNIASYSLLTHIFAKICNMIPGDFVHTLGDVHIYDNHREAVEEQLLREPRALPKLKIARTDTFWSGFDVSLFGHLELEDFQIEDYNPYPSIKAELSTGLKK